MRRVFQKFVERLNESNDREGFHQAMSETAIAFELPCFAYLSMPRDNKKSVTLISNYPLSWTDHYLRARYEELDPVVAFAHRQVEPFEWGLGADTFDLSSAQARLFDEAAQFGIRCGFTIPVQCANEPVAAVTFASDERRPIFQRTIDSNRRVLQLMAIQLHEHVRRKFASAVRIGNANLSPRELECLRLASQGKSRWDSAKILGLSPRAIKFHLDNVRTKLGVRTVYQAVALLAHGATLDHDSGCTQDP